MSADQWSDIDDRIADEIGTSVFDADSQWDAPGVGHPPAPGAGGGA